jgi:hypothetical protein
MLNIAVNNKQFIENINKIKDILNKDDFKDVFNDFDIAKDADTDHQPHEKLQTELFLSTQ